MKTTYDPEVDALYLYFGSGTVAETVEVRPGVILDLGADGRLVGMEILDASTSLPKDMDLASMDRPSARGKIPPG